MSGILTYGGRGHCTCTQPPGVPPLPALTGLTCLTSLVRHTPLGDADTNVLDVWPDAGGTGRASPVANLPGDAEKTFGRAGGWVGEGGRAFEPPEEGRGGAGQFKYASLKTLMMTH